MNKILTQKPQVVPTLKAAFALYLWQFKKNAAVLLPVIFLQIYVQYKVLGLVPQLSVLTEEQAFGAFAEMLGWGLFSSFVLFMAYADIVRRLFGFPLHFERPHAGITYLYWLFKKALTVMTVLFIISCAGGLILIGLAITMGFVLTLLGIPVTTEPPVWLSMVIMLLGVTLGLSLITHFTLMCFPIAIDKNDGPIDSMWRGFTLIKPYRHYGYQMAMILLMVAVLPNMIVGSVASFFSIMPGMPWQKFILPALISTSIGDFLALFLLCVQLAVYQQLHANKKQDR
jgi:hypothetical protein